MFSAEDKTGIVFQYPTGGRITASVYDKGAGSLYVLSKDRYIYSLTEDGKMKWRFMLDESPSGFLAVGCDSTVYAGTVSNSVYAVNPRGGKIWKFDAGGRIIGNAAITPDGNIIFATDEAYLYSVSHRGVVRYRKKLNFRPALSPLLNKDFLFLPGEDERIHVFDHWGKEEWIFVLSGKPLSAAVSDSVLWIGTETGTVAAVDMNGQKMWSTSLGKPVTSLIVPDADNILAAGGSSLFSIRASGDVRWSYGGRIPFYSVVSDGNVYAATLVPGGIAFFSFSGHPLGSVKTGRPSTYAGFSSEGWFFTGSRDWNLYTGMIEEREIRSSSVSLWLSENGTVNGNRTVPDIVKRPSYELQQTDSNDFGYLKLRSDSRDMTSLNTLLDGIEVRLASDKPDSGKAYLLSVLEYVASDCITRPYYRNMKLINDFPAVRGRAVGLLGEYGDFVSQEVLLNLLFFEWDSYVLRSIVTSIGLLGYNPDNVSASALFRFYVSKKDMFRQYSLDEPLSKALKGILRYSGSIGIEGVNLALAVLNDSGDKKVRQSVLDLLKTLKK